MSPANMIGKRTECIICGSSELTAPVIAREMMLGTRHEFSYTICSSCRCIQLLEIPKNLGDYYPPNYYSMRPRSGIRKILFRAWAESSFERPSWVGRLLVRLVGKHQGVEAVRRLNVEFGARILDVGCGSGDLLFLLKSLGFSDLTGVDPYLADSYSEESGLKISKSDISSVAGAYDVVMFNHSLEHVPDPLDALRSALRVLAPGGTLVVRIPVADNYAWRKYGVNWVGLDPPRHIFVPTEQSMRFIASELSLRISDVVYESDEFMFWASEQYRNDIALNDCRSYAVKKLWRLFPGRAMRGYRRQVRELNSQKDSDTACFLFQKLNHDT